MKEKCLNVIRALLKRAKGMDRARLGWYGALAAMLVALGAGSYAWRNRPDAAFQARPQSEPAPVMAVNTPSPVDWLTALPTPAPTPEPLLFQWPVDGEIVGEFAPETLVWSETMRQWQTHPAIDIAAEPGESVRACADGVVSDAWEDKLWGKVIQIEHPEGYVSTYANLSTIRLVKIGDAVTAGQTISAVGGTAACEAEMPWHLHFSLEKDGEAVNFDKIVRQSEP